MSSQLQPGPFLDLAPSVKNMGQSATLAINERSRRLRAEGREVFRLGLGQSPFPVPECMERALCDNAHQKDYLAVEGLPALRQAVTEYLHRTEGLRYDPAHVLIGPGTKELMFIVQLVYRGELVIPSPSWVSYAPQARIVGRKVHWLSTHVDDGLGVHPETLEQVCKVAPEQPRLLILNYPGNPTGMCYGAERLEAIAAVARRYRMVVLSDEIYSGTHFEDDHQSIARWYPEGTIVSNGLSKWAGAGGWRLGAFAFPEQLAWLHAAMTIVASETFTSTSAPIQYAAVEGFRDSSAMREYQANQRRILAALSKYARERLMQCGAQVVEAKGGFYLFPSFEPLRGALTARGMQDGASLCETLLEATGVAVLPGSCFGRPCEEFSFRMALVDFDGGPALAALASGGVEVDMAFLETYCPRVVTAVERMARWFEGGALGAASSAG